MIPKFRSTDEEADWWESREGKRVAAEIMRRGLAAGTAKRRRVPLKTVTMRLPEPDIEAAKDLAERKGTPIRHTSRCSCTRPSRRSAARPDQLASNPGLTWKLINYRRPAFAFIALIAPCATTRPFWMITLPTVFESI